MVGRTIETFPCLIATQEAAKRPLRIALEDRLKEDSILYGCFLLCWIYALHLVQSSRRSWAPAQTWSQDNILRHNPTTARLDHRYHRPWRTVALPSLSCKEWFRWCLMCRPRNRNRGIHRTRRVPRLARKNKYKHYRTILTCHPSWWSGWPGSGWTRGHQAHVTTAKLKL